MAKHDDHKHGGSVALYIGIALVLAVITYLEFALVEYPVAWLSDTATIVWLVLLSVAKFILVILFFMHLVYDSRVFSGFFGSGMFLAVATVIGLALLFNVRSLAGQEIAAPIDEPAEVVAEAEPEEEALELPERSLAARLSRPAPKDQALELGPEALIEDWHTPIGPADVPEDEVLTAAAPEYELDESIWTYEPGSRFEEGDGGPDAAIEERIEAGQIDPEDIEIGEPDAEQEAAAGQGLETQAQPEAQAQEEATPDEPADDDGETPAGEEGADTPGAAFAWQELGGEVYTSNCASCHQANGQGIPGAFPPLAGHLPDVYSTEGGRDYLVNVLLYGLQGQITVEGQTYNSVMPAWSQLSNEQIAAVLNHELTSWGNAEAFESFEPILPEDVEAQRGQDLSAQQVYELRQGLGLE